MTSISAGPQKLTFTPQNNSYYYTKLGCISASTQIYTAIQFPIKGPSGASVAVELQTSFGDCGAQTYQSHFVTVSAPTGNLQVVTIPLSRFTGAILSAMKAIVWSEFGGASGAWELGKIELVCAPNRITSVGASIPPILAVTPTSTCSLLLVDDWISQSRLTFLFYNAMLEPSSDDITMTSITVSSTTNRVTITPKSGGYFYSSVGCLAASAYGGVSLRIKAAVGTTLTVQLQSSATCTASNPQTFDRTSAQLGWTFDGTEKLYTIPLASFLGLDKNHITSILFYSLSSPVTFGPMAFYCGSTVAEYTPPPKANDDGPITTIPITSTAATPFIIDQFTGADQNTLGFWHGADPGMSVTYSGGKLTLQSNDVDLSWYTQISETCQDMQTYENAYLHITYSGSTKFTISMQQHNPTCDASIAPYPETWDEVEASRYAVSATDIYIPLSHFSINKQRTIGFSFKAFQTTSPTTFSLVEIVKTAPSTVFIPAKLPTAPLYFACTRPNSFAFAIDDGVPELAQEVMQIIRDEGITVTFFTVGLPLLDKETKLADVYKDMSNRGHQIALHSFTHPRMEGLPTVSDLDWELTNDVNALQQALGMSSKYFRPPFGTEGARLRQRLAALIPGAKVINWSVDVEDWLWATSSTPEKQLDAFKRDLAKGGNLVVMHYLYPSTVGYLKQFIQLAKATGKQLMRVDQCLGDPAAPPL